MERAKRVETVTKVKTKTKEKRCKLSANKLFAIGENSSVTNSMYTIKEDSDNNFSIDMANETTLFYMILVKWFKKDHGTALYYNFILASRQMLGATALVLSLIIVVEEIVMSFASQPLPSIIAIIFACLTLIGWIIFLLNVNFALWYFKKKSVELLWNFYQISTSLIILYYVRYKVCVASLKFKYILLIDELKNNCV